MYVRTNTHMWLGHECALYQGIYRRSRSLRTAAKTLQGNFCSSCAYACRFCLIELKQASVKEWISGVGNSYVVSQTTDYVLSRLHTQYISDARCTGAGFRQVGGPGERRVLCSDKKAGISALVYPCVYNQSSFHPSFCFQHQEGFSVTLEITKTGLAVSCCIGCWIIIWWWKWSLGLYSPDPRHGVGLRKLHTERGSVRWGGPAGAPWIWERNALPHSTSYAGAVRPTIDSSLISHNELYLLSVF